MTNSTLEQTLEQLYSRFASEGDVAALAEVFDRVAPDLERLARRLSSDRNQAADLVQATFLTAMERPGTFETGRPLRPWLLGILVHRASAERRMAARPIEPERLSQREVEAPLATLGAAEFRSAVARAVDELPESMRQVVAGRVLEERDASELAEELAISQGALRVRLHRGLERLRRSLPAGLATGFALVFMHSRGLARARSEVLRRAAQSTAGKGGAAGIGAAGAGTAVLSKKLAGGIGALAMVLLAGWFTLDGLAKSESTQVAREERQPLPVSTQVSARDLTPQPESTREVVPTAVPASTSTAKVKAKILLESGGPAVGFEVVLDFAKEAQGDPVSLRTGDEGLAVFDIPGGTRIRSLQVPVTATTPTALKWIWQTTKAGQEIQLELVLSSGWPLSGTVVDQEGRPVPGAMVSGWSKTRMTGEPERTVLSDSSGRFHIEHLGPDFVIEANTPDLACFRGLRGKLSAHVAAENLTIVLAPARRVHGVVYGQDKQPIANAEVVVTNGLNSRTDRDMTLVPGVTTFAGSQGQTTTDEKGAYEIGHLAREECSIEVKHAPYLIQRAYRPTGEVSQDFVLDMGASLRGRVWTSTGQPASGAQVRFWPSWGNVNTVGPIFTCNESGEFLVTGLLDASTHTDTPKALGVMHEGHAVHVLQPIQVSDRSDTPIEIRLDPERIIAGQVVDESGDPAQGITIRIEGVREVNVGATHAGRRSTWEYHLGRDECTSDEQGNFQLDQLYDGEFLLRASLPGEERRSVDTKVRSGQTDLLIALDPVAMDKVVLEGAVRDALTGKAIPSFTITPMLNGSGSAHSFNAATDGQFELTGLTPGPIQVIVEADGFARTEFIEREYALGRHHFEARLFPTRTLQLIVRDELGKHHERGAVRVLNLAGQELPLRGAAGFSTEKWLRGETLILHGLPATQLTLRFFVGSKEESGIHDFPIDLLQPLDQPFEVIIPRRAELRGDGRLNFALFAADTDEDEAELQAALDDTFAGGDKSWFLEHMRAGTVPCPESEVKLLVKRGETVLATITGTPNGTGGYKVVEQRETRDWGGFGHSSSSEMELDTAPLLLWLRDLPNEVLTFQVRASGYRPLDFEVDCSEPDDARKMRSLILRSL